MNTIQINLTAGTDVGLQRTNNEDNFVVNADLSRMEWYVPQDANDIISLGEKGCLLVVADGMGGMNAGEIASGIAIETIQQLFSPDNLTKEILKDSVSIEKYMKNAISLADMNIKNYGKNNPDARGMGTTLIMAWILKRKAYIAWCGDSRAYSFHPTGGLIQLSKDHSFVQELVDSGKLESQYAFDHPDNNIVTRSLGDSSKIAVSDFMEHDLFNDEIILLCSDGLSGMLRDREMQQILSKEPEDMGRCKNALIEGALNAGGVDNITVALFKLVSGSETFIASENKIKSSNSIKIKPRNLIKIALSLLFLLICALYFGWYLGYHKKNNKIENPTDTTHMEAPVIVPVSLVPTDQPVEEEIKPVKTVTPKKKEESPKPIKEEEPILLEIEDDNELTPITPSQQDEKNEIILTETEVKITPEKEVIEHIVKKGEGIASIAREYKVLVDSILKWNDIPIEKKDKIREGQKLIIKK